MLTIDILGSSRHFGRFSKWPPRKMAIYLYRLISAPYHLLGYFLAEQLYLRFSTPFLISKTKFKILKMLYPRWRHFESQFSHIFINIIFSVIFERLIFNTSDREDTSRLFKCSLVCNLNIIDVVWRPKWLP